MRSMIRSGLILLTLALTAGTAKADDIPDGKYNGWES
jgi:hypothetical protein